MDILIATTNPGKRKAILQWLGEREGVKWKTLKDVEVPAEEPVEDGATYEANALIKAKFYAEATGMVTIAEDAGFVLDGLPGTFGLRTRRQIDAKTDVEWLGVFLEMIDPLKNRQATFSSAMALYDPKTQTQVTVQGDTEGEMVDFPAAPLEPGIPVSAVFVPDGYEDVYSAMGTEERRACNHRAKSCRKLNAWMEEHLFGDQ